MIYLDNSATTRPYPEVLTAMEQMNTELYGNVSSLHMAGVTAEQKVSTARETVATALNANANEIYFGPSGTFCNNAAILGTARAKKRIGNKIVISAIEHACVRESAKSLEAEGFTVCVVEPTAEGYAEAIDEKTVLVSAMFVNNETGLVLPVEELKAIIENQKSPALLHIDAVQAFGKLDVDVKKLKCDLLTVSAHKIHGPKGIAALYVKKGVRLLPVIFGGGQEKGLISGTHNSPAIVGFGVAAERAMQDLKENYAHLCELQDYFIQQAKSCDFLQINRDERPHAPHIINVSFMGYVGENVLHFLENEGIYVSVGSACSNNTHHGSILSAMHKDAKTVDGAIRVSFGHQNTKADIDAFFDGARKAADTLIKKYRR